jgi:thioredoxin-related protein
MKSIYILLVVGMMFSSCQDTKPKVSTLVDGELNWLTIEQAQELQGNTDKLFLVDVYTDWCGWCKVMDKKTFTDEGIKKYLDENFYVVKFNAEQKEPITFNGKEYLWRSGGRRGVNTLAIEMLNGRLGYPSLVFLDSNLEKIKVVPGYKTPDQLMDVIKDVKAVL